MQILTSIPRFNPQPRTVREAREYATALDTIRQFDRFQTEVSRQNQQPNDLDSSKHGIALHSAFLKVGSRDVFVTGTMSLQDTEQEPGAPVGMRIEAVSDGDFAQLSYDRSDARIVYAETRAGTTTKIVHYLDTDTISVFRD